MKNSKLVLLLVLLISAFQGFAQEADEIDPMPIKLKGQVLNLEDEAPVPFAFVLNFRTHTGVTTNAQGLFTMDMLNIDSLEISSIGFSKVTVHVPANYNEMNVQIFYAKPIRYALPGVTVKGEQAKVNMDGVPVGTKSTLDPQLRGDAYNKKPPVLAAVINPISFLQYYTSKREKEKRETRLAIVTEKKWEFLSQYYNKELVMELTGLSEFQADSFMIYFNSKQIFNSLTTEYEVREAIKEIYKLYRQEGH
ncbi:MAG TPA: carboxypeptidase-like regulatory domain-containing protein [Prolixibacteraceae bacterium]